MNIIKKYFLGIGIPTFLMSPINVLIDIVCIPFFNKKVYQLSDFPQSYQKEIKNLLSMGSKGKLVEELADKLKNNERGMVFYQWYGVEIKKSAQCVELNNKYKYIKTIGVSVFNHKVETAKHFGPFRVTIRMLYNLNDIQSSDSYIDVGNVRNYWSENKLFLFDDTLLHQSINQTDELRHCLFVDILRPSLFPWLMNAIACGFGFTLKKINSIFYKKWVPLN